MEQANVSPDTYTEDYKKKTSFNTSDTGLETTTTAQNYENVNRRRWILTTIRQ